MRNMLYNMHNSGTISSGKDFAPSNVPNRIISASSLQLFQGNVHPEKSEQFYKDNVFW